MTGQLSARCVGRTQDRGGRRTTCSASSCFGRPRTSALAAPSRLQPSTDHWAEKDFPEAVAAAKIKDFRLHDTRHTFASRLAMEGVDLLTIKELGGWKTLSMVQRYAHLSPGHQRQAIERLVTRTVATPRPAEATGRE